jgi:hypothetical protein
MDEGEGPPVAGEDGVAAVSKEDVHRPEQIWPALFPRAISPTAAPGA